MNMINPESSNSCHSREGGNPEAICRDKLVSRGRTLTLALSRKERVLGALGALVVNSPICVQDSIVWPPVTGTAWPVSYCWSIM